MSYNNIESKDNYVISHSVCINKIRGNIEVPVHVSFCAAVYEK